MVEVVARALCAADGHDPDKLEPGDVPCVDGILKNGDPAHYLWREFMPAARAAIEAMREHAYFRREPDGGYRSHASFTAEERRRLWPMAETFAMLDGNAFFTMGGEYQWGHVACYLPEADALYQSNGGDNGWASEALLATKPFHDPIDAALTDGETK